MTIAEYIAGRLADAGVRYVFGVPGGPSIPYMEAFRKKGIEFILTSNEASAGIMADVVARLTGRPGVCHATFGPGATNLSTGVGEALLDRSPVIAFTSEMPDEMLHRTTQMNISHQKLFGPITKSTFRLDRNNVREVLNSALSICFAEYPGPVHIGLPAGLAGVELPEAIDDDLPVETTSHHNDIQKILSIIDRSAKPVIAAGLTAKRIRIGSRLISLAEKYRIPVVLTPMAKGLIPEDHPLYAGVLFHSLSDYLDDILENTDLVIGIGYDAVEFNYESWVPEVPVIHFDTIESDKPSFPDFHSFTGEPDEWFRVLNNLNAGSLMNRDSIIKDVRDEMESVFRGFTNHFGPAAALSILREELPSGVMVTADVGSHLHMVGQFWNTGGNDNLLMSNGWSGMGFGIPAAMAVQLTKPDATVVCITGDGGFLMMAGEILTARRYNLPIIIVVFSDGELNLIRIKQSWKDLQPYATSLYQGDMFASGMFLGTRVLNVDCADKMRSAVIEALAVNEPVIINAMIDPEDYKWLIVKR